MTLLFILFATYRKVHPFAAELQERKDKRREQEEAAVVRDPVASLHSTLEMTPLIHRKQRLSGLSGRPGEHRARNSERKRR